MADVESLLHFSDRPDILRFDPHVPSSSPDREPGVWAIDRLHAPAYWFPRDCPRACWWEPGGKRVHAVDAAWVDALDVACLHEYVLPPTSFEWWGEPNGYYFSREAVEPLSVRALPSARELHDEAGIELQVVDDLWVVIDDVVADHAFFSVIRKGNLHPR